jgi:hypothetical protein
MAVKVTVLRFWRTPYEDRVWLSEWFTESLFVNDVITGVAMITCLQSLRQSLVSEWRHNLGFHSFHAYPTDMLTIQLGLWVKSKPRFEWEPAWYTMRLIIMWIKCCSWELYWNSLFLLHGEHITSPLHLTTSMLLKEITSFIVRVVRKVYCTICKVQCFINVTARGSM